MMCKVFGRIWRESLLICESNIIFVDYSVKLPLFMVDS